MMALSTSRLRVSRVCTVAIVAGAWAPASEAVPQVPGDADPLEEVLLQMEAAGEFSDLSAQFTLALREFVEDEDEGETRVCHGQVRVQKGAGATRTWIRIDSCRDGEVINQDDRRWYVFDGASLVEAREKERRRVRYQFPDDQRQDPFRLGEGPFPLPFGQTRADMHREFEIQLLPLDADGRSRLICTPKDHSTLSRRYLSIELFLSRDLANPGRPEKIVLQDRKDRQEKTIEFSAVRVNSGLAEQDLQLPAETRDWSELERPFDGNP